MLLKANGENIKCQARSLLFDVSRWSGRGEGWWKPCRNTTHSTVALL